VCSQPINNNVAYVTFTVSAATCPSTAPTGTTGYTTCGTGLSAQTLGINIGHQYDPSWISFIRYAGVNSVRIFGTLNGVGLSATLQVLATSNGGTWGNDLNGVPVTNLASFNAAVGLLRTTNGRNPNHPWVYPPVWSQIELNLNTSLTEPTKIAGGNSANSIGVLNMYGIPVLATMWLTCDNFEFASFDLMNATYWGERWELYKHQYILAIWNYNRNVTMFEFWNEPDLNADCNQINSTWLDQSTIRPLAIRNAFTDLNADVINVCMPV
jgi:hypothetical protein